MITIFDKPDCSKELFFAISNSLQIVTPESKSKTHKFAGIYVIYKDDVCYYVGQSQNLASRISQHMSGKYSSCDRIDIYYAVANGFDDFYSRSKESRKAILDINEMAMIKNLGPIENLITPGSDFNISDEKSFYCLYEEDEKNPSCSVIYDKSEICVSLLKEPSLICYSSLRWHNREIIEAAKSIGFEALEKEVC